MMRLRRLRPSGRVDAVPADTTEAAVTAMVPEANTADLPSRIAAFDSSAPAAAARQVKPAAATLPGIADAALPSKEIPPERFHGRWIVGRVAADATAPRRFASDRGWIGRTLQLGEEAVGWIAGGELTADRLGVEPDLVDYLDRRNRPAVRGI
ncbi:hypothetical protein [Allosphingosinicella deserti]|uniref:Uncharacterized protein n=1 Tax=Allosphingosinicella deserti TaxID=2116704 RepID=A0A2P7QLP6_9SPHN|nr:hypothetical protein [Sphingomonas deserti]PSJ38864.1 hypothetical protein C7I55_16180 [Sphingomonas deserti]